MNPINYEEYKGLQNKAASGQEDSRPLDSTDVLAMIIAMFQLVMPFAFGFMGISLLTILLFKWLFV